MQTEDFARAYDAFAAKRKPEFEGRTERRDARDRERPSSRWPFFDGAHRALAEPSSQAGAIGPIPVDHADDVDARCRDLVASARRRPAGCACRAAAYGGGRARSTCARSALLARRSRGTSGLADFAFAMQGLGTRPDLALRKRRAAQRGYLPRVASGEAIAAFALSEPEAGCDVAAIDHAARRDGGQWVLDGDKTWISNGGIADHYVVFARDRREPTKAYSALSWSMPATPG